MKSYAVTDKQLEQNNNNFKYHKPFSDQNDRYVTIRDKAKEFANMLLEFTPQSREQSLALTKLEESVMWANSAIARNEKEGIEWAENEPIK